MFNQKISVVSYLNAKPFIYGLMHAPNGSHFNFCLDIPAVCAAKLATNEVQVGLIPVAAMLDMQNPQIITDYCISAHEAVNSVFIFANNSIDEIHTIVGAGGASGSLDASNMFKPALARGEIQCIGATTLDEYRQFIEKDGALDRRFQKVIVNPATPEETVIILNNIKEKYEEHHNVTYTPEAIEACVNLTTRYMSDRFLPDKAIDALDEAGSRVHITNIHVPQNIIDVEQKIEEIKVEKNRVVRSQKYEEAAKLRDNEKQLLEQLESAKVEWEAETKNKKYVVTEDNVAEVVSMMTGIPIQRVGQSDSQRLLNMADELKGQIIGQDEAIIKLAKAIRRTRAGLKDPKKPIGSFIFLGPTGVGKTELAKVLARFMFESEDSLIRIDMSEYMEKFAISRLVGAPPGYVGYEEGGQLTEKVRRKPYAVILLDEIEKAHPDVFNLLLQVLELLHELLLHVLYPWLCHHVLILLQLLINHVFQSQPIYEAVSSEDQYQYLIQ